LRNLRGAFMPHPARLTRLQGQHVVLVDDVMTTGATLRETAHVLRQAGAAHVTALVFARTPVPSA
jgi:predicted amidophosphoribosyltransferase